MILQMAPDISDQTTAHRGIFHFSSWISGGQKNTIANVTLCQLCL